VTKLDSLLDEVQDFILQDLKNALTDEAKRLQGIEEAAKEYYVSTIHANYCCFGWCGMPCECGRNNLQKALEVVPA